jgi:D-ribose pyranose/furanose isomerase RbsD
MRKLLILLTIVVITQSCHHPADSVKKEVSPGWEKTFASELNLFGHRNWILVVDKAFPAQTATGITVINSGAGLPDVLDKVLTEIGRATHVKPVIYTDHELSFISPEQVPGIEDYRSELSMRLKDFSVNTILHDSVFVKIDQASRLFKVLVIKTEEVIPYSSVFIELDCRYWTPEQEAELRGRMRQETVMQ